MERKKKSAGTRQAWLEELGRRLAWHFPAVQMKDILSDYQEQFEAGQSHGKTEAEIIAGLGTPAEAAALLLEEEPAARTDGLRQTVLWGAALAVCLYFEFILFSSSSVEPVSIVTLLYLPVTASMLFLLIRGPARVWLEDRFSPERTISPVAAYCVPAALVVIFEVSEQLLQVFAKAGRIPNSFGPFLVGEINTWFILVIELALFLLLVRLAARSLTNSIRYFPGIIHTIGAMGALFFTYVLYHSFVPDAYRSFPLELLLALLPYFSGLLTALAFQRWVDGRKPLPRLFQGGAVTWQDWRHRLGVSLLGWYDAAQAAEILEDYQERYELGREQGRDEEVLLAEMGRPENVVRDLLAEDQKARLLRRRTWLWAIPAAYAVWNLLVLLRAFKFGYTGWLYYYCNNYIRESFLILLLGVSLFFLFHARGRSAVERRFPAPHRPAVWAFLPPLVIAAALTGMMLFICAYPWNPSNLPARRIGIHVAYMIEASVLLLCILAIWTLARCFSGSIRYLPAAIHAVGCAAYAPGVGIFLHHMDVEAMSGGETFRYFLPYMLPYGLGLVLASICWLVLRAAGKKEG